MNRLESRATNAETERAVLRAMCVGALRATVWREAVAMLVDYRFTDDTHQLIFDNLRESRTGDPRIIRELLPARLNSKELPDPDVETYFQPHNFTIHRTIALRRALCAGSADEERPRSAAR